MKKITTNKKMTLVVISLLLLLVSPAMASPGDTVFVEKFDTQEDFNKWTTIDLNGGRTWEWLNGHAAYMLDYQTGLPGDDYLVSPAITLQAGNVYDLRFSLTMSNNVNYESCRVYMGTSPDTAHLKTVLAEWKDVTNEANGMKELTLIPKQTGTYYIAFYSFSQANQNRFEIDDVSIVERSTTLVPGDVTHLSATAAPHGALQGTIRFQLPTLTASNDILDVKSRLSYAIYRDTLSTPITTGTGAPGDEVSYMDNVSANGFYTYRVVASNDKGAGRASSAKIYIGKDTPLKPTGVTAHVGADFAAHVAWHVSRGSVNNGYVDSTALKYIVLRDDSVIATTADTTYIDKVPVAHGQTKVSYTVKALFDTLASEPSYEAECLAGEPIVAPYVETFANGETKSPWMQDASAHDFDWQSTSEVYDDWTGEALNAPDGDGGYLVAAVSNASSGDQSRYVSPLLNLSRLSNPQLSFYFYYNRSQWYDPEMEGEINDRVQVQVSFDGGEWQIVDEGAFRINDNSNKWQRVTMTLPKQDAKFMQIGLLAISDNDGGNCGDMYVDSISVDESSLQTDLALTSLEARQLRVTANDSLQLTATVRNRGAQTISNYQVTFLRNGQPYTQVNGISLARADQADIKLNVPTTVEDAQKDSIVWQAVVSMQGDELSANDSSELVFTSVRANDYPAPVLEGQASDNNVRLTWNALASQKATTTDTKTVTDDFESYDAFAVDSFGQWTCYDGDKASTLISPRIPVQYAHEGEPMAWQVFNNVESGTYVENNYDEPFRAHSGIQYLASPSCNWPAENNDWLITPRLDGQAQTIKFWAKGATFDSEWMDVYYSTTDNHHDSFVKLNDATIYVNEMWKQYSFDVPQGARYFALRNARRTVFLFIDDFTYQAYNGAKDQLDLTGYNVYRDGVRLNETPVTTPSYTDTDVKTGSTHTYRVTAVYAQGESNYSNGFSTVVTGLQRLNAHSTTEPAAVYNMSGMRTDKEARGVNIVRYRDGSVRKIVRR